MGSSAGWRRWQAVVCVVVGAIVLGVLLAAGCGSPVPTGPSRPVGVAPVGASTSIVDAFRAYGGPAAAPVGQFGTANPLASGIHGLMVRRASPAGISESADGSSGRVLEADDASPSRRGNHYADGGDPAATLPSGSGDGPNLGGSVGGSPLGTGAGAAGAVPGAGLGLKEETGGSSDSSQPLSGQVFTWRDGDRTLTVHLQKALQFQPDADAGSEESVARWAGGGAIVKKEPAAGSDNTLPVFVSGSGTLMTLPGGVVLVLDEEWDAARTGRFFSANGIASSRVREFDWLRNGFFVETEPGFPSLVLANSLADQDGVELSSPNWSIQVTTK